MAKKRGVPHPEKALTAVAVRNAKPGWHADGHGLYLEVDETGARRWVQRLIVQGRRRDIGLGSASLVSLAEARETALANRRLARSGGDPLAARRREKARAALPTFEVAARSCHEEHEKSWKPKHAAQWISTLEAHAFSVLGAMRVDQIGTPEVHRALAPIWIEKAVTARRVLQRISMVLDWAAAKGFCDGENPARGVTKGLPKQRATAEHFAALPWQEVPAFLATLRETEKAGPATKLLFEWIILTAARSGEARGARWSEVDLAAKTWTVPATRMKAGKTHVVPLSPQAVVVLEQAQKLRTDDTASALVFPSAKGGRQISDMTLTMLLRRMEVSATVHGFRSSFRDWAAESTNFPREVAEAQLAHAVENRVEAAYRRSDLLVKRRRMVDAWGNFCTRPGGKVVPISRPAAATGQGRG
ncbi:tyrosine-type recombinase/integrase [Azospirillum sp. ST 5-10]|uniref:tyrosine-type recombinase/integrase n=1 Tax=unclassified Azospirillum TaxID=2630922 RepID=UPI003F4A3BA8